MKKRSDPCIFDRGDFAPKLPLARTKDQRLIIQNLRSQFRRKGSAAQKRYRRAGALGHTPVKSRRAFSQRVLVKARVVKANKKGRGSLSHSSAALKKHLLYLSRSGITIDGKTPTFFTDEKALTFSSAKEAVSKWSNDEHHFRFIISPENGSKLDLPDYIQSVVSKIESNIGTNLEWFGVCHYNTDNPHAHLLVRGVDEKGEALILSKEFISNGIRAIAEEEATLRLGLQQSDSIAKSIRDNLNKLAPTKIDYLLIEEQAKSLDGTIRIFPVPFDAREWEVEVRSNRLLRLNVLSEAGLAKEIEAGIWRLDNECLPTLKKLSRNERLRKVIEQDLPASLRRTGLIVHGNDEPIPGPIIGEVVARKIVDELTDSSGLVISASDGNLHFVPISRFSEPRGFPVATGQIVSVSTYERRNKAEDIMARYANRRTGIFDWKLFEATVRQKVDENKWQIPAESTVEEYLKRYAVRLSTLIDKKVIEEVSPALFRFPIDLSKKIEELESKLGQFKHHAVTRLSFLELDRAITWRGKTYLDDLIFQPEKMPPIQSEFGSKISLSVKRREHFLENAGIKREGNWTQNLLEDERKRLVEKLAPTLGNEITPKSGTRYPGTIDSYHFTGSGIYMAVSLEEGFILRRVKDFESRRRIGEGLTLKGRRGTSEILSLTEHSHRTGRRLS